MDHHHRSYSNPSSIYHPFHHPQLQQQQQQHRQHLKPSHSYPGPPATPLQVSTINSTPPEHDEYTARPSNAQVHAQFHAQSLLTAKPQSQPTSDSDYTTSTPGISRGLSRPLTSQEQDRLAHLDKLKFFLATAPSRWDDPSSATNTPPQPTTAQLSFPAQPPSQVPYPLPTHPALNRFLLPTQEYVTCVLWSGLYHITGTDIVRALVFRFESFGRPVRNVKKFEEGVFSDLRNLKPGIDACLEEPKSPFLDLLFKYQCIRTQKKQKVFYWFSVPHDRLFLDALERDLKREKMGLEPTTVITGEPAQSFTYDPKRSLYEQFSKAGGGKDGECELEAAVRRVDEASAMEGVAEGSTRERNDANGSDGRGEDTGEELSSDPDDHSNHSNSDRDSRHSHFPHPNASASSSSNLTSNLPPAMRGPGTPFFSMFSLFEGSPTYKQRRKKGGRPPGGSGLGAMMRRENGSGGDDERGRRFLPTARYSHSHGSVHDVDMELEGMSAADMFVKQARGELMPAGVAERRKLLGQERTRSHDGIHRHTYPVAFGAQPTFGIQRPAVAGPGPSYVIPDVGHDGPSSSAVSAPATTMVNPADTTSSGMIKTKAFVCPLFSCGRLFKRMEHLKRHLRTHTMERPYQCQRCKKRFSRSDNLNQHLRTHVRDGATGMPGVGTGEWEYDYDDGGESGGMESEEVDELEGDDGLVAAYGLGMDTSGMNFNMGYGAAGTDAQIQMCEVEVQGDVQDVPGDEEGLVTATTTTAPSSDSIPGYPNPSQELFYTPAVGSTPPYSTGGDGTQYVEGTQWANRPHPSPAFSTSSAPSPPPGLIPLIRSGRSSLTSSPAGYMRNQSPSVYNSSNHSGTSGSVESDYVTSISAPSHKQAFDHASLYPPNMLGLAGMDVGGAGPVRRHRSMTPSLIRNVDSARRPVTSSGGDFSQIGSAGTARGYHPYASAMYSHGSRNGSAQSSPSTYPIALDYSHQVPRAEEHPRSSSGGPMQDHMRQMMNMNLEQGVDADMAAFAGVGVSVVRPGSSAGYGDMYRTDSPAPFSSDSPLPYMGEGYGVRPTPGAGQFAKHALYSVDPTQFSTIDDGYYSTVPPQHVTM